MSTAKLSSLNPQDLIAAFSSNAQLSKYVGDMTTGSGDSAALHLSNERPTDITAITGIEVVVHHDPVTKIEYLLDGREGRQRQLKITAAAFGGDLKRFGKLLESNYGPERLESTQLDASGYAASHGGVEVAGVTDAVEYLLNLGPKQVFGIRQAATDAPHDGAEYVRVNGEWVQRGTADLDLSGYDTSLQVNTKVNDLREHAQSGYEFTGAFEDRLTGQAGANDFGTFVSYTSQMVTDQRWLRFGFSSAANAANDNQYWGETDPNYDSSKGLFGGLHLPPGVNQLFDFDYNDSTYSQASEGSLKYTAANGTIDFTGARPGDLALVRFDFNVVPQVVNTTIEVAMIFATRNDNDEITFTFPLTGEPIFYGTGTVGRTFLNRPLLSAYFASQEDVNARALLAIRADNPVQVAPLTTLVTLVR